MIELMWYDWTGITLFDSLLFSIITLLILYLVGSGILRLICALSNKSEPFTSLDFLVKTNFRILFGFIFIFLIVMLFSIFNISFFASTLLITILSAIGFVATRHSFKLRSVKKIHFQRCAPVIAIFIVLLTTIFLSSMLITGFYGSTNDDAADHTLMTRIILDNPNALLTRSAQPYASFHLYYPSGAHVLCAFLLSLLNVSIQKIVIMTSAILPCLIALAFYSTIKSLFGIKFLAILGLVVAAFFTIGLTWAPISWGGLPVLLSLYLSVSSMGLIFVLLKEKMTFLNASLLGLIFFISVETYPDALLIIFIWSLLILSIRLFSNFKGINISVFSFQSFFSKRNMAMTIAFLIPVLLTIPFFYSNYTHMVVGVQFNELSSSASALSENIKARIGFNWLFDIPALSLFFSEYGRLLALAPYSLILLIVLLIPRVSQKIASIFPVKQIVNSLFLIYVFMLILLSYLTISLFLSFNFLTTFVSPERVWQHIFIPGIIMTAVVLFSVIYSFHFVFKRLFLSDRTHLTKIRKNRILAFALLALLISSAGLLSVPIIKDQQGIYGQVRSSFSLYQTLNQDDILLIDWIKENTPKNEYILVSASDSGQYLTAITQRQTISRYTYLANYSDLMTILTSNSSDLRAVPLMVKYNVSYVYIGSTATTYALQYPYYRHFNATQFLSTPYFTLTKEVGDAWLFQFNASAALSAYNSYGATD